MTNYSRINVSGQRTLIHFIILQTLVLPWHSLSRLNANCYLISMYPPKYLVIVVNDLYIFTTILPKNGCSIPMGMTVVLGLHKLSMQATIDHHGPSMYSGHYTASTNCCKKILLQRQQNYRVWNYCYQKLLYCLCGNVYIDYIMVFGLRQEDGSFD